MNKIINHFTKIDSNEFLKLEEEIAFFYGASNIQEIKKHYIDAILIFEKTMGCNQPLVEIKKITIPHLVNAYSNVIKETNLKFNLNTVATLEFNLIYAQSQAQSFEDIYQIMINLYQNIFNKNNIHLVKAAMLRTFLYQYKVKLLIQDNALHHGDVSLLRNIAKASEKELENLI